jgi:betaine reductase
MDLENQNRVKNMTEKYGAENMLVLIGAAEAEAAGLAAETVMNGDPTYAGSLTGVQFGLRVYHVVEPEFKDAVDANIYDEQIGMMEMVLDVDEIISEMTTMRDQFCKFKD